MKVKSLSCVRLLATPWTAAYQASPSMGFSRQEYWSGMPSLSPTVVAGGFIYRSCFTDREVEAPRKQVTCSSSLGGAGS